MTGHVGASYEVALQTIESVFPSMDFGKHKIRVTQYLEARYNFTHGHFRFVILDMSDNVLCVGENDPKKGIPRRVDFDLLNSIDNYAYDYDYWGAIPCRAEY